MKHFVSFGLSVYFGVTFGATNYRDNVDRSGSYKMAKGRQFLEQLWPIFGIGRYLGFFPCQQITDYSKEKFELKPIDWKIQWTLFILSYLILGNLVTFVGFTFYFLFSDKSLSEIQQCTMNSTDGIGLVDFLAMGTLASSINAACLLIHWGNFKAKDRICQLSNMNKIRSNESNGRITKPFICVMVFHVLFTIISTIFISLVTPKCLEVSWIFTLVVPIPTLMQLIIITYPMITFYGIVLEVLVQIIDESMELRQQLNQGLEYELDQTLNSVDLFIQRLKVSKEMLSTNNFYITCSLSLSIMVLLYVTPHQVFKIIETEDLFSLLGSLTYTSFLLSMFSIIWHCHITAQETTDEIHQLKESLKDIIVVEDVAIRLTKTRLEEKLEDFKGFDGKGYFIMGKSFLKNLLAFCVTYFVILMQFKLTEQTSK